MRRYGLRDDQWDRIKDILPGREGHVGATAKDNRCASAIWPMADMRARRRREIARHAARVRWANTTRGPSAAPPRRENGRGVGDFRIRGWA
jgi:hypothetical protein